MREILVRTIVVAVTIVLMLGMIEVALRVSPSLIGIAILDRFPPELGRKVATELGLSTQSNRRLITSQERTDKGPNFYTYTPNQSYLNAVDAADQAYGATDTLTTDSLAFCNPPELAKSARIDIVVIAGSLPNCAGTTAEQNFNIPLGQITGLTAYNMAVPRVGPNEYVEVLRKFGLPMKPRIVLMAISEGNDLRDIDRFNDFVAGKRDDEDEDEARSGGIFAASYALAFLKGGLELAWRQIKREFIEPDFRYAVRAGSRRVPLNVANADLSELTYAKRMAAGRISADLYAPPLREFVRLAGEAGFVPMVVLVPAAYSAYAETVEFSDPSIAQVMNAYSEAQRDWFKANAAALGFRYVDATPAMREAARTRPLLYFPSNVHLTAEGHRVLAEAVAPEIARIPARP